MTRHELIILFFYLNSLILTILPHYILELPDYFILHGPLVGVGGKRSTERFRERSDGCAAFSRLRRDSVMETDASDSLERALELGRDEELNAI